MWHNHANVRVHIAQNGHSARLSQPPVRPLASTRNGHPFFLSPSHTFFPARRCRRRRTACTLATRVRSALRLAPRPPSPPGLSQHRAHRAPCPSSPSRRRAARRMPTYRSPTTVRACHHVTATCMHLPGLSQGHASVCLGLSQGHASVCPSLSQSHA